MFSLTLCALSSFIFLARAKSYMELDKTNDNLDLSRDLFQQFLSKHQKQYTDEEAEYRFQVFQENLKKIDHLNQEHELAVFGVTPFSDMTTAEIQATVSCVFNVTDAEPAEIPNIEAPLTLDYRQQNLVTEVKNQGQCGSCYIFGAMGDIEGQHAKNHKQLISLSEQYPLDCSSFGCYGGWPNDVANWLSHTPGAVTTQSYPYVARKDVCKPVFPGSVRVQGAQKYLGRSVEDIKKVLAQHGPLAVVFRLSDSLYQYKGGPITPSDCNNGQINHAVTLVGYTESYWIIKNSYGTDWGDAGYLLLNFDNQCNFGKLIFPSTVY